MSTHYLQRADPACPPLSTTIILLFSILLPTINALRPHEPPIEAQVRNIVNQSLVHLLPNLAGN